MNRVESDVVLSNPPCQGYRSVSRSRWFVRPDLLLWSMNIIEPIELTGQRRHDAEREARISQLGLLIEAEAATPLWQRVCMYAMYSEIRARSADQWLAMELAIQESMR